MTDSWDEYERKHKTLFAETLGETDPFFHLIACLRMEERFKIGRLCKLKDLIQKKIITIANPEAIIWYIDNMLIPFTEYDGKAGFTPDLVSHFAMKTARREPVYSAKKKRVNVQDVIANIPIPSSPET